MTTIKAKRIILAMFLTASAVLINILPLISFGEFITKTDQWQPSCLFRLELGIKFFFWGWFLSLFLAVASLIVCYKKPNIINSITTKLTVSFSIIALISALLWLVALVVFPTIPLG